VGREAVDLQGTGKHSHPWTLEKEEGNQWCTLFGQGKGVRGKGTSDGGEKGGSGKNYLDVHKGERVECSV